MAEELNGWDGVLPDSYGMPAAELMDMMISWKRRNDTTSDQETESKVKA